MKQRGILVVLEASLVCLEGCALVVLYDSVSTGFENWPTLVFVRPLVVTSIAIGGLATALVTIVILEILNNLIHSFETSVLLRLFTFLRIILYFSAFYAILAFSLFWIQTHLMHPTVIVVLLLIEVVCFTAISFSTFCIRKLQSNASAH